MEELIDLKLVTVLEMLIIAGISWTIGFLMSLRMYHQPLVKELTRLAEINAKYSKEASDFKQYLDNKE